MLSFLSKFQHKQEMRESKDEMLIGEIVLAMSRLNFVTISFRANDDQQAVRFKPKDDPILHSVAVILDRKTGSGVVSEALIGSKATLTFQAEVKNRMADPDDLLHMYRTDLQNIFKVPLLGDVRLDHQLNSVLATKKIIIEIGSYVLQGDEGREKLQDVLEKTLLELREKLQDYKKA